MFGNQKLIFAYNKSVFGFQKLIFGDKKKIFVAKINVWYQTIEAGPGQARPCPAESNRGAPGLAPASIVGHQTWILAKKSIFGCQESSLGHQKSIVSIKIYI